MPPENGVNEGYRRTHSPTHGADCTFVLEFVMLPPLSVTPMKSRGFTMNLHRITYLGLTIGAVFAGVVVPPPSANAETGGSGSISDDIITAEVRFDAPPQDSPCVWEAVSGVDPVSVTVNRVRTSLPSACCCALIRTLPVGVYLTALLPRLSRI